MNIKIENKKDKEIGSLTNLSLDDQVYNLTDKEWIDLINKLVFIRPDLINEFKFVEDFDNEANERIAELTNELNYAKDEVAYLQEELLNYE